MKSLESLGLKIKDGEILVLDQRRLPDEEIWTRCESAEHMADLIRTLAVRGAPLIGVAAAVALAREAESGADEKRLTEAAGFLRAARPTAVNLMAAVDRMRQAPFSRWARTAEAIFEEDIALCDAIGSHGARLIEDGSSILTHCNAGGLATAGIGTAIGVIRKAFESGKKIHVYVDETRPLLQGARLTAWELGKLGIPYTLICDNMAAGLMRQGKIHRVITGADRIALNGDFANKIGTYGVAVLANHHQIPFYCAAPYTTVDPKCRSGREIPIEERNPEEVRGAAGAFGEVRWSPKESQVFNPAFDVTPVELLSALILDRGVYTRAEIKTGALLLN
jgi:methylthioribose-1-phosphate isomerase